ncbi:MAG: type II toxin-antitoxin system VapC family toxin [Bythopirellula sp.]|nr:type II toxin-antitoxin system VapC family toxin [Bythopirellula sp.]
MIVLDASCLLELLLQRPSKNLIAERLVGHERELCAPSLVDVETCHVLRRYLLLGELSARRGREAVEELMDFPLERYPQTLLLSRIWQLRSNLTAYDATYVALAEALNVVLLTCDKKLANSIGHKATIEVIAGA